MRALARLGWTQVTIAEYSGYDRRTIGRWTRGESAIPLLVERHLDLLLAIRDRLPLRSTFSQAYGMMR